jgi:hypothetical protein
MNQQNTLIGKYEDFFEDEDILKPIIGFGFLPDKSIYVTNDINNKATHVIKFYNNIDFKEKPRLFEWGDIIIRRVENCIFIDNPSIEFVGTYENAGNVKGIGPWQNRDEKKYVQDILNVLEKCHDNHYANYEKRKVWLETYPEAQLTKELQKKQICSLERYSDEALFKDLQDDDEVYEYDYDAVQEARAKKRRAEIFMDNACETYKALHRL